MGNGAGGAPFVFGSVLPREVIAPVDAVVLPQEFAQCPCSPSCALQQLAPGHLKTPPGTLLAVG